MRKDLRTYCEIDLEAIAENLMNTKKKADPGVKLCAVIKTDGYGHGAVAIADYVKDIADFFAVATIDEAVELRECGVTLPILILGYTMHACYDRVVRYDVSQTIYNAEDAKLLEAIRQNKKAKVHIAVDTGMGRIGVMPDESGLSIVKEINSLSGLFLEGMFTHFSTADETDKTYTLLQMERYDRFASLLASEGIEIPIKHVCNSAGIMEFDHHRFNMVRSGIITYGLYPSNEVVKENLKLKPALSWKAHVVHVKTLGPDWGVSYGKTFVTSKEATKVATINVGYGDGYPRCLSGRGRVLIHGQSAPIIGRVCMDQFMVDVSHITDVAVEDEVTLVGRDGEEYIPVEEISDMEGTINYEFVCDIGKRVPRVWIRKK